MHRQFLRQLAWTCGVGLLACGLTTNAFAESIDFETLSGSSVFGNPSQTLNIGTTAGNVKFEGGVILTGTTNLPADETSVYGTASFGSTYTNPLTITFDQNISNFFLDVLNGETFDVTYRVADNMGNSADFLLVPNLSSGQTTIGFAAAGNVVTVTAITTGPWDFFIDNVHFNEALPPDLSVPEPASLSLAILGIAGVLARRRRVVA